MSLDPAFRAILSPCTGVCTLDPCGLCQGCHRSAAEIASWPRLNDEQRLHLMESILPVREARRV